MTRATRSKRVLAALVASSIMAVDVQAATTDINNQPLSSAAAVSAKPNILFILDNSGSMEDANMPDDMSDSGKYGYKSIQCNGVAFDPTYTYVPPIKADGTTYPDVSFTNALNEGFAYWGTGTLRQSNDSRTVATGSKTFNLDSGNATSYVVGDIVAVAERSDGSIRMTGTVTAWNDSTDQLTLNITAAEGSGTYNQWYVSRMNSLDGSTYYQYTPYTGGPKALDWTYNTGGVITSTTFYQECMSNIGSTPGSSRFTLQTVTTASSATLKQNYANWNAYYRTRRLMMRTAAGRAFFALNNNFRVGFSTISDTTATEGTNKFINVADYDATQKAKFFKSLYTADGNSNTPLRGALAKAGRYFAYKAPGQTVDPMQYSCQRNYAILSTDGYWNTGSETASYGPHVLTANTSVGQQDGAEVPPMNDGGIATVTTVTTTVTTQPQQTVTVSRATTNFRRYQWTIAGTTSTCSGTAGRYANSIQQQDRSQTVDTTTTATQNVVTTSVNTQVVNSATGVIVSDTTTNSTSTSATGSSASTGATNAGTFGNTGGATGGCATSAGLTSAGLSSGSTVYSTTSDTTCFTGGGNSCNYNATGGAANSGGNSTGTTNSVVSGPTTSNAGTATSTVTSTSSNTITGGVSSTLADVADYYYKTDLRDTSLGNCTSASSGNNVCANDTLSPLPPLDLATHQHMTTYTIGLGVNGTLPYDPDYLSQTTGAYANIKSGAATWPDPITYSGAPRIDDLWHAAVNGRGRYFATSNANTLSNALVGALADATKVTGSAAGASTNSLEPVVGQSNQAYIATYRTIEWTGDVKAYPLDALTGNINTTTATWSAQTQLEAKLPSARAIKYMQPTTKAMRAFNFTNLTADGFDSNFTGFCTTKTPTPTQCGTLSGTQKTTAGTGANMVNFLRGEDTYEIDTNLTDPLYRERAARLGDIINASPVYVKKSNLSYSDTGHATFVGTTASRKAMLYAAGNDGMLHAFDAATGDEVWAFVPSFVMPNMYKLADAGYKDSHTYFVDGTPVVGDVYNGTAWKTILVGGLNSGGRGYYALDITDPDNPVGLWEFTHANMGLTYGNPVITKRTDGTWVVAFTSGLNNIAGDGMGHLFVVNAMTGALLQNISNNTGSVASPSGLNKINAWVEAAGDNTARRFYGGDMLGNLWRFDTTDSVLPAGTEATILATFQNSSTSPQPITTKPQLTVVKASNGTEIPVVVVGTGRYLGTSDVADTTLQSIYAIKDGLTDTGWGDVRTRSDLVSQTVTVSGATATGTANAVDWLTKIGWKLDLSQSKERIVVDMVLNFNLLTAASAITGANECNPSGGKAWLYRINVNTGTAANGTTLAEYLGAYLVVGVTQIRTADGKWKDVIVGSDASVQTKEVPPFPNDPRNVRRSAWRELIN